MHESKYNRFVSVLVGARVKKMHRATCMLALCIQKIAPSSSFSAVEIETERESKIGSTSSKNKKKNYKLKQVL